jgi:hypothetical protein
MTRKFSSISIETTLATGLSTSATSITVASGTGSTLMGGVTLAGGNVDQFTIAIDPDTALEEIVFVTAVSSDTLTIVRARAGSSAIAHSGGATVKHVLTSNDLDYFNTAADGTITGASTTTLTNKTIAIGSNTVTGTTAQFNTALTDGDFATLAGVETLTNKTVNLTSNTVTGTTAQFNTALSDNDFATLAGTETLTNKTLTTPVVSIAINSQTAAYTLIASDKSKMIIINSASTANLTVPSGVFSAGDVIFVTRQGAGACTITASGTTITGTPGLVLRAQYSVGALLCTAANTFIATGDLSA